MIEFLMGGVVMGIGVLIGGALSVTAKKHEVKKDD